MRSIVKTVKSAVASGRLAQETFRRSFVAAPGSGDAAGAVPAVLPAAVPPGAEAPPAAPATAATQPPLEAALAESAVTATGKQGQGGK